MTSQPEQYVGSGHGIKLFSRARKIDRETGQTLEIKSKTWGVRRCYVWTLTESKTWPNTSVYLRDHECLIVLAKDMTIWAVPIVDAVASGLPVDHIELADGRRIRDGLDADAASAGFRPATYLPPGMRGPLAAEWEQFLQVGCIWPPDDFGGQYGWLDAIPARETWEDVLKVFNHKLASTPAEITRATPDPGPTKKLSRYVAALGPEPKAVKSEPADDESSICD